MAAGIRQRHRQSCTRRGKCDCTWQAEVFDNDAGEKIRRTFPTYAAARGWRHDALVAVRQGQMRAATSATLREVADAWLEGASSGLIRTRSGDPYKPSAVRGYRQTLDKGVLPILGHRRFSDLRRSDLQDIVEAMGEKGRAPATIRQAIIPLKAICRRELHRGRLAVNPTLGLELPAVRGGRERFADPVEAAALLAAVPDGDRVVWATAMYAGLRRGELMALAAGKVDVKAGLIHVDHGWDMVEGMIATKGRNRRRVPIIPELRELLVAEIVRTGRRSDELLFGRTVRLPFDYRRLTDRADAAWEAAELNRITLHECRHSFAALMIAAGVNAKALCDYMGHSSIQVTFDKYGHLMPGNEDQAAGLLHGYLERTRAAGE